MRAASTLVTRSLLSHAPPSSMARRAAERLATWRDDLGEGVVLAATNHHTGGRGVASAHQAAGLIRLGDEAELSAVIRAALQELGR